MLQKRRIQQQGGSLQREEEWRGEERRGEERILQRL
jgi:hypothetical protein